MPEIVDNKAFMAISSELQYGAAFEGA